MPKFRKGLIWNISNSLSIGYKIYKQLSSIIPKIKINFALDATSKILKNLKKYQAFFLNLVFLILGILLLWLAFRKQDFRQIGLELQKIDWWWGFIVLIITILNHIIRAYRWNLLIHPIQPTVRVHITFSTMMFGFLVNLAIPRLGEISRCWTLHRIEKVPFAPLLGTMITERVVDVLSLGIVTLLAFIFQYDLIFPFFQIYILPILGNTWASQKIVLIGLILIGFLGLGLFVIFWRKILKISIIQPFIKFGLKIWEGILSIRQMPPNAQFWFLFYTVWIWVSYHGMTYFWFFSFPATSHLGVSAAFLLLAVSSFARLVPIQAANMGAYHYLTIKGLLLLGVAELHGATLAFVIHIAQVIYTLVFGGVCTLYILYLNRRSIK
jgi:uncharacterized membrane protein YbhN (UPF0104 family)